MVCCPLCLVSFTLHIMHFRFIHVVACISSLFLFIAGWSSSDLILILQVDSVVAAEYELEYLLLEGHCYDVTTGQPPRGLQFTLGTSAKPVIVDTIVMANLVNNQYIRW